MKNITVRLPESLVAEIETESRRHHISKSDIVRDRLQRRAPGRASASVAAISDLIGQVNSLPADLSAQKNRYLKTTAYGKKRAR